MNDIEALLEKYYNGDTSLGEERRIREYLALHPESADKADVMLAEGINAFSKDKEVALPRKGRRSPRFLAFGGSSLAAALALVIVLRQGGPVQQQPAPLPQPAVSPGISAVLLASPQVSGEIQNEQLALEQARKALAYVSSKLNKGITGIQHFNKLEQSVSTIQNKEKS